MDAIDREIIRIVQHDARVSYRDLGRAAGLSPNAAADRLRRLLRIPGLRLALGLTGAAVLAALGGLALRHATQTGHQAEPPTQITSAPRAYLMALSATAPNPLTITSWAAVFAAASTARITHTTTAAVLLLAGIGLGTATWFTVLSTAMTLVRRLAGRRVHQAITIISGLGLIAFGIILAWQTAAAGLR